MGLRLQNPKQSNSYNLRIFLLMGMITLGIGVIIYRLFILQVVNHDEYLARAISQHSFESAILAKRGEIYLTGQKNSSPMLVATNITLNLVYASGREMNDEDRRIAAIKLSPILQISEQDLLNKLINGNPNYSPLKHELTEGESQKIKDLKLAGIHLDPETIRYYPQKTLASQILGFVGYSENERVGQYGIERRYEKELAGINGSVEADTAVSGALINFGDKQESPAVDGDNLYLTIDPAIQFKSQEVLDATVQKHGADSGSVIVANPKTGQILAMANYPDFDPNDYNKAEIRSFNNNAISSEYEPGSVFKAFTVGAGLKENKITPQSTYTDEGFVKVDDWTIKNSDPTPRGEQTMTQALDESLNTGMVYIQQLLGQETFRDYVKKFGFGKLSGVDLPNESEGNLEQLNSRGQIFFANASFGQGVAVTGLQLVQAYSAIANGGKMMKPYVVDKIIHADGIVEKHSAENVGQILDLHTAGTLSAMLVDVVENGHGKRAGVSGYYIAGKTGTAQVAYTDRIGYDPHKNIGTFVGFGPVNSPEFVMLIRIDNPRDVKYAESTAAPAFSEIASFILNYLQIPPTR